jgi:flagellar motor switch protein FliN/FliY
MSDARPEAPLKAPDEREAPLKAPDEREAPLKAPDQSEATLEAPDKSEQTEQAPLRLSSLAEETPVVEPAGFPPLGPDLGTGPASEGAVPRPEAPFKGPDKSGARALNIRLLSDIPLEVTVELGRAVLTVSDLLALRPGSVVELTASASTVDVVVNGRLVARGDVVVVEDSFGVRVTEIVEP